MTNRIAPPDDISPREFFTHWVPEMVRSDDDRRRRLGDTEATIVFAFTEVECGAYTLYVKSGEVHGEVSAIDDPDLRVELNLATWRSLNRGDISAPEAALRRRVKLKGDLILALKLHLILG